MTLKLDNITFKYLKKYQTILIIKNNIAISYYLPISKQIKFSEYNIKRPSEGFIHISKDGLYLALRIDE